MSGQKMHTDEVRTDVHLIGRLLAAQFPQWAELPIAPVSSSGTDNALYRLGEDMAVRLPRIESAVKDVDKEHHWLPRIAPHLPVAIPTPLAKGIPAQGLPWHWSICRWLDGEPWSSFGDARRSDAHCD
jgi:aminoglycoside phosphotransferase (APT) family kinase protein